MRRIILLLPLLLSTLNLQLSTAFAQGSLTPPGVPAPTMKSLDQIEPRIDVLKLSGDANNLYIITNSGSYYLTTNVVGAHLKIGISIRADNVTLDLNGFALIGSLNSTVGIFVPNFQDGIVIRNGTVQNWLSGGIIADGCDNSRFERLIVGNTDGGGGLETGHGCVVSECVISSNSPGSPFNGGIATREDCTISSCATLANGGFGISAGSGSVITHCIANSNERGGFEVSDNSTVTDCAASFNFDAGFTLFDNTTIVHCTASGNFGPGISSANTCTIKGCSASANRRGGIEADANSSISDCSVTGNTNAGILVTTGCIVTRCTAGMNGQSGISASDGDTIETCSLRSNVMDGIRATNNCQIIGNLCTKNGNGTTNTADIHVFGTNNRIDGNHCIGNTPNGGNGIKVEGFRNLIIRNSSKDHLTGDYDIVPGAGGTFNSYGQILGVPGNNFNNSNPWANFSF